MTMEKFDINLKKHMETIGWTFQKNWAFKNRVCVSSEGIWYLDYRPEEIHRETSVEEAFGKAYDIATRSRPLLVSDVDITKLRIGQVVKFPAHWAVIIQITAEIGGCFVQRDTMEYKNGGYNHQRYSSVMYLMEHGRVVQPLYHMNNDYVMVNRVLQEYNIVQHPKGTEFFRFDEIVKEESHTWKELIKEIEHTS